jgi:hypothetical protein
MKPRYYNYNTVLYAFVILTLIPLFLYLSFLFDKIFNPYIKNGTYKEFLYAGLMIILLIIADYFIVRKLIKDYREN